MVKNIIIDCDPGHDDAMAILLALAHEDKLNVLGITTVSGNQSIDKITRNAKAILEVANRRDIPLAEGASHPIKREPIHAGEFHGETGMDGPIYPEPTIQLDKRNAVEFMKDLIDASDKKVTLVPIGPMTNIALLLTKYPEVKEKIELISFMGGAIEGGNWTPVAEFNIAQDPEAADIVFNSGLPLVMSGLKVSYEATIKHNEIPELKGKGKVAQFTYELLEFYKLFNVSIGEDRSPIHDACSIAYLIAPEIFKGEMMPVQVETNSKLCDGQTVADRRKYKKEEKNHNVFVLLECDREKFKTMLFDAFLSFN